MSISRPSPWLDWGLRLALGTGVGHWLIPRYLGRRLTRAHRRRLRQTPSHLGLSWEPLSCQTGEGYRLAGWVVSPDQAKATVVMFHGMKRNREVTLSRTAFLVAAGYRCVAFDHRAHGESQGQRSSFGYHEAGDVAAVLSLVRQRWPNQPHASLGISMGAAALCFASEHSRQCQALILESLYPDILAAWAKRMPAYRCPSLSRLTPSLIRRCEQILQARFEDVAPSRRIADLAPTPLLILTGEHDHLAPPEEAQALFAARRGPGEMWIAPGARHNDVCEVGGQAYCEILLGFLDRWVLSKTAESRSERAA